MNPLPVALILLAPFALAAEPVAEPITPAELQAQLNAALARDPAAWAGYDLDRDRVASQVEIVLCLARRPAWMRERFPQAFAAIDSDHDGALSFAELSAFARRAGPLAAGRFDLAQHQRSIKERSNPGAAGGNPGAAIGVDSGGGGGTHAYIFVGQQQSYVADYDVVNGQYDPVIGVLGSGVVLEVADARLTLTRGK